MPFPCARRPGRGARLTAATLTAVLLTAAPAIAAAAATPAVRPGGLGPPTATTPATQVQVDVTGLTPRAPHPGQVLQVTGTIRNNGSTALADVNVQLRLSTSAVQGRDDLATLAGGSARPPGDPVASTALGQPLGAGSSAPFALGVPVDGLRLGSAGVYPLAVEVIADDPTTGARTRFGTARTFLPWDMSGVKATRVAVVWPVSAGPTRDANGVPMGHRLDDQLTGRLDAVLTAAAGVDVSWLLDGDTLESASVQAAGAPLSSSAGSGPPAANAPTAAPDPTAKAWLERLVAQTANQPVLALPYADPDVTAVVRAGLSDDLATATSLGTDVTGNVLGRTATGTVRPLAWPAEGTADRAGLVAIQQTGTTDVLLSDAYADPVRTTTYTPSGIGPLSGTSLTAVTADATLSRLLSTPVAQSGGPALGEQRLLAETAMIGLELPSVSRALVVVPPRGWTPDPGYVHGLLQVLGSAPWVHLAQLTTLTTTAATGPGRQRPTFTAGVRDREVDAAQLADVRDGHQRLAALGAVLSDPQVVTDTYTRALLRAESSAWRGQQAAGRTYAASVVARLTALQARVHLLPSGPVTLAARSGRIPVTVVNDLDLKVTVRVGMQAVPAVRMTLSQPPAVVLEPHSSTTLDVAADATTNGSVQVVARLLTSDGAVFGPPQTFAVQVTGFGAVAGLVVGGALVLLSVALVVRVVRAIRGGRRPGSPSSVRAPAR